MREPDEYWSEWADRLADAGARVALIGALAASLYRQSPRLTTDVDFLADELDGVAGRLRAQGFEVREELDDDGRPYLLYLRGDGYRVDVLAAETEYQREALARAEGPAITVEDVIIHKLIAWRARDRDDVRSILSTEPDLDLGYLERWIDAWGVAERWSEIRRSTD